MRKRLGPAVLCLVSLSLFSAWTAEAQAQAQEQPQEQAQEKAPALVAVPEAPLDGLQDSVREQLATKRAELDGLLAAPSPDPSLLVPAFGDLGRLYLLYDRPETAVPCFQNVTRLVPGEPNAWYYLGVIHQDAGRFDEALAALTETLKSRPDDLPSLLRQGEILLQLRRLDEAEQSFQAAARLDPDGAAVRFGLGRVASAERRYEDAAEHFRATLAKQPDADSVYHPLGMALRRLKQMDAAKEALTRAGPSAPIFDDPLMRRLFELSATSRSYFIEGNRARRRGLVDLAERHYRKALELDPADASTHYNLGTLLGEAGRVDEAQFHFRQAVAHDPEHRDARFNLAVGLRARGDLRDAVAAFQAVAELDPGDLSARLELGATLYAAGERERGLALWDGLRRGFLEEPVTDVPTLLQLVRYLMQSGRGDVDGLLSRAEAVASGSDAAELFLLRADRAVAARNVSDAVIYLEKALEFQPSQAQAAARLADLYCAQGREGDAVAMLEASLKAAPDGRASQESLSRLLATKEDPDPAETARALQLAQAVFKGRQGPVTAETMAMAMAATGDFAQAVQWQRRLVREVAPRAPADIQRRLHANLERFETGRRALSTCLQP